MCSRHTKHSSECRTKNDENHKNPRLLVCDQLHVSSSQVIELLTEAVGAGKCLSQVWYCKLLLLQCL